MKSSKLPYVPGGRLIVGVSLILWLLITSGLSITYAQPINGNSSMVPLPTNVSLPVKVGIFLTVNKLYQINEVAGTFTADVDIGYRWVDPSQGFNKESYGIDRKYFAGGQALDKLAEIWTPAININNLSGKPQKEDHGLFIYADGTVQYIHRLTAVFETQYNLGTFPFDSQYLAVRLSSSRYGVNDVDFVVEQKEWDNSIVRKGWTYPGWQIDQVMYRQSRIAGWDNSPVSEMIASLLVKREPLGHIMLILIPMLIVLLFPTLYLFDKKTEWSKRLRILSGATLGFITQYFAVSLRYPALTVDSAVLKGFRVGFCYFFVLIIIFMTVYNEEFISKRLHKHYIDELQNVLCWAMPILLLSLLAYTLIAGING